MADILQLIRCQMEIQWMLISDRYGKVDMTSITSIIDRGSNMSTDVKLKSIYFKTQKCEMN